MRSTCVTIVAILLVFHHAAFGEGDESCTDPWGEMGNCRNLTLCDPLFKLVLKNGEGVEDIVRQSVCDFTDLQQFSRWPIVCCPLIDHDKRKYNGSNDDNDNKDDTKKKPNSPYGPYLDPICGVHPYRTSKEYLEHRNTRPWATALGYLGENIPNTIEWMCSGSLISSRHVLTAAHCVYRHPGLLLVRLGDHNLERDDDDADPIDIIIDKRTIHPQFDFASHVNDIAVLRLQDNIVFTDHIQPICLPIPAVLRKRNLVGRPTSVVGWGYISYGGSRSAYLKHTYLSIVSEERCKKAYKEFRKATTIDERVLCASHPIGDRGTCSGDSGGPLMLNTGFATYIVGVVSYGYKCNEPDYPNVFTRVSSFLDFIESLLN